MKPIKLKQDMEKYEDTNTLIEEFIKEYKIGDDIAEFYANKFNQKLEEIEESIEKEKLPFKVSENTELRDAFNNGLDLSLQIIKNKKN